MTLVAKKRTIWLTIFISVYVNSTLAVYEETLDGYRYTIYSDKLVKWSDANEGCLQKNSQLLYIDTLSELEFIDRFLRRSGMGDHEQFWTSGNDIDREGYHIWTSNGKTILSTLWARGEPNNYGGDEDCAELRIRAGSNTFTLNDENCSVENYYICKIIPTKSSQQVGEENATNTYCHDTHADIYYRLNNLYAVQIVISIILIVIAGIIVKNEIIKFLTKIKGEEINMKWNRRTLEEE